MTTETRLGWGVVGTGDVSRSIASDLALVGSARRLAVCSRSLDRARAFAAELGFERGHGSFGDLLRDADIDLAYIGTPHSTHSDLAIRAIEAGKHVLVEKPMGIDAADVERVADAARAHGRFAMEAMWMKFHPYYRSLLHDARSGVIGEVTSVRAYFGLPFGDPDSARWSAELSSSTLLDQGIYPVTLAHDLFGAPVSVSAVARTRDDGVDLSDHATLEFAGGRFAHIAASMVEYLEPSASINGTAGWLGVPAPFWATDRYTRHTGSLADALMAPETVEFERAGRGYVPMLRAVGDAIGAGWTEHPDHTLAATVEVARTLDRIRAAAAAPDLHAMEPTR